MGLSTSGARGRSGAARWTYVAVLLAAALATFLVLLLRQSVVTRKAEATQHVFRVVDVDDTTTDPAIWGKNYPRQYDRASRQAIDARCCASLS